METIEIELFQRELKRIFTEFLNEIKSENYFGKERELISRFTFSKLVKNVGCCKLFYDSAQISIETRVAQIHIPGKKQKPEVCKDLIIWPIPNQNCFNEEKIPLCIMEWKHNKHFPAQADIDWLKSYTAKFDACFGIAVNVNTKPNYKLKAVLIEKGEISQNSWLNS